MIGWELIQNNNTIYIFSRKLNYFSSTSTIFLVFFLHIIRVVFSYFCQGQYYGNVQGQYLGLNQVNLDQYGVRETGGYIPYDNQYQYGPVVRNEAGGYGSGLYGVYQPGSGSRLYGMYQRRHMPYYPYEFPQYLYGRYQYPETDMGRTQRSPAAFQFRSGYWRGFNIRPWRGFKK